MVGVFIVHQHRFFTVAKQLTPGKGEMTSGNLHQLPELSYPKN